jgi:deazaflavin-dependent oxidoreductase (nitroreductase family)
MWTYPENCKDEVNAVTNSEEQFVYITTLGRKSGLARQIEIWFVERDGRLYCLAEHGRKAHWVRNILANPAVTVRLAQRTWQATARVLEPDADRNLFTEVRELAHRKYGWGHGLPVEFRLDHELV